MKIAGTIFAASLITLAFAAAPPPAPPAPSASAVATPNAPFPGGTVANDLLTDTTCRANYLIIARASTEPDNIGITAGPALCTGLQQALSAAAIGCQGIGNAQGYDASLADNVPTYDGGILTSQSAVTGAMGIFNMTSTKCPNANIVATGYSQGTAVMYNSISKLPTSLQNKIKGVVLFGYTANVTNNGEIPNFPAAKTKVFCSDSLGNDGVCTAKEISVNAAHLDYASRFPEGVSFLQGMINGTGAGAIGSLARAGVIGAKVSGGAGIVFPVQLLFASLLLATCTFLTL